MFSHLILPSYTIDHFLAAVDFELLNNSIEEAEQFAREYIDFEEKEYCNIVDQIDSGGGI